MSLVWNRKIKTRLLIVIAIEIHKNISSCYILVYLWKHFYRKGLWENLFYKFLHLKKNQPVFWWGVEHTDCTSIDAPLLNSCPRYDTKLHLVRLLSQSFALVGFGLVLWHINHRRLFNAKSCFIHIYWIYDL